MSRRVEEQVAEVGDFPAPETIADNTTHPYLVDIWNDLVKRRLREDWTRLDLKLLERLCKYIAELEDIDERLEHDGYEMETAQGVQLSPDFRARARIEAQVNTLMQRLGLSAGSRIEKSKLDERKERLTSGQSKRLSVIEQSRGLLAGAQLQRVK